MSDEVYQKAMDAFDDVMECGHNSSVDRSSALFSCASKFLQIALDASLGKRYEH